MGGSRRVATRSKTRAKWFTSGRSIPTRRLVEEQLETRLMLAQTTGLFFHEPEAADGYVLFAPNTSNRTFLINKDGQVVNTWQSQYLPGLLGHLEPDGSLIRDAAPHGQGGNGFINAAGAGGLLERFAWNGTKNWEFAYDSSQHLAHHDFEIMPNGNFLLIAWEYKTEAQATQAGRDPNLPGAGYLYPDHIVEVHPDYVNGGGTIVWEWHIWDHLVQEFDPTKNNYHGPTGVEDNPQLIDVNYVSTSDPGGGQAEDWTHANGIDYNAELDQIALSVREFSEVWIIDHSTTTVEAAGHTGGNSGRGGDLLYRWGNPQTYDRGDASDRVLYYQHDVRWIPDGLSGAGNLTVFNNGLSRPGTDYSSIEEFTPPLALDGSYTLVPGESWGPTASTWTYAAPVANFSAIISGAVRLENGNTLITYGVKGNMTEVTPAGDEVWKYVNPYAGNVMLGPEDPIPPLGVSDPLINTLFVNFVFQAQHYPHGYLAPLTTAPAAARHIFYNQSAWDGNSAAINPASDNAAIATDKSAYLPNGTTAGFNSITSFSRGITGIMVDLSTGVNHTGITASDFVFKVGNNNSPGTWAAAPPPSAISVVPGGGVSGSDRVIITWPSGSITNQWLEVQVLANTRTGIVSPDVHFWGNKIGDSGTGTPATTFSTTSTDAAQAFSTIGSGKPITDLRDYNRDGKVTSTDAAIVFASIGSIPRLNIGPGGPFSPEASPALLVDDRSSAVATALALRADGRGLDAQLARPSVTRVVDRVPTRDRYFVELLLDRPIATNGVECAKPTTDIDDDPLSDMLDGLPF